MGNMIERKTTDTTISGSAGQLAALTIQSGKAPALMPSGLLDFSAHGTLRNFSGATAGATFVAYCNGTLLFSGQATLANVDVERSWSLRGKLWGHGSGKLNSEVVVEAANTGSAGGITSSAVISAIASRELISASGDLSLSLSVYHDAPGGGPIETVCQDAQATYYPKL